MIEDDIPAAMAKAKADNKSLFVEVWAPWCHTCLSMKNFVLPDPAIVALTNRVVFATVDSDRDSNAAFMDRYAVNAWPTLFVLDPANGGVLGLQQGSLSVGELRTFINDAVDLRDAKLDPNGPTVALLKARRARAKAKWNQASRKYRLALQRGGASWNRRSEALEGLLFSEYRQKNWTRCTQIGAKHVATIEGTVTPADFSALLIRCAARTRNQTLGRQAHKLALERLKRHTDQPPQASSVDDKSDALSIYASGLRGIGNKVGALQAIQRQIALLEAAAAAAPSPKMAATFDYARMGAYLSIGRGARALTMLRKRVTQLPDSYEAPARLAQALIAMRRRREALAPLEKAIANAYGPRRIKYLKMRANIYVGLGDKKGERSALEALVKAYEALPRSSKLHATRRAELRRVRRRLARLPK